MHSVIYLKVTEDPEQGRSLNVMEDNTMLTTLKTAVSDGRVELAPSRSSGTPMIAVARHPKTGALLAVRPLLVATGSRTCLVLRVHMQDGGESHEKKKGGVVTTVNHTDRDNWPDSYKGFDFDRNHSAHRAMDFSVAWERVLPNKEALNDLTALELPRKLVDYLADRIPAQHWLINRGELTGILTGCFNEIVAQQLSEMGVSTIANVKAKLAFHREMVDGLEKQLALMSGEGEASEPYTGAVEVLSMQELQAKYPNG